MSATTTELREWLETRRQVVESALEACLQAQTDTPGVVADAMRYALLGGGKRLRPLLVIAAAEAVADQAGRSRDEARALALPAACAIEMIHTYSLVHDDLPAMDNDTMRRGRPTTHVVFGDGMGILAGDALLTEAFGLLARSPQASATVPPAELNARKLETLVLIAAAAGAAGMVGGQALDLKGAAAGALHIDAEALRDMHMRKTGALIRASALAGAILAGGSAQQREAVSRYGTQVGLAFQIVDDILDVEGASAELGKTAGKDAAAGKPTYPAICGLEQSRTLAAECLDRALASLDEARLGGQLAAIGRWIVGRTN